VPIYFIGDLGAELPKQGIKKGFYNEDKKNTGNNQKDKTNDAEKKDTKDTKAKDVSSDGSSPDFDKNKV